MTPAIYVVSGARDLFQFDPTGLTFTKIGTMDCKQMVSGSPLTAGVDRTGAVWVVVDVPDEVDGGMWPPNLTPYLWKISARDAGCLGTTPLTTSPEGMSFVRDDPGSPGETLFFSVDGRYFGASQGIALGTINPGTGHTTEVGPLTTDSSSFRAGLTGAADGRLFAIQHFYPWASAGTNPLVLSERDKTNAVSKWSSTVVIDREFAAGLVHWGESIWFFLSPSVSPGPNPAVGRYQMATSSFGIAKDNIGFDPIGAGISMCAP